MTTSPHHQPMQTIDIDHLSGEQGKQPQSFSSCSAYIDVIFETSRGWGQGRFWFSSWLYYNILG
jgi:hypothetical protein